ncbi:MAG TPA: thioesterase [Clostridia bacterium]|nr:thioesterase [Clostridia bacterium]
MHIYENYIIKESMCDCFRRLKLQHMFVMMQDVAYKDLDSCGYGRKSLLDKDIAFLLRRSVVKVLNPMYADDLISVGTSQISLQGMTYTRDFIFKCNNDTSLLATTQWFLCKISDKSLLRPEINTISYKEDAVGVSIGNKPEIDCNKSKQYNIVRAGYSSIDGNMHVNNTEYVAWVCDAPDALKFMEKGCYDFDIYFKKEVVLSDNVVLKQKDNTMCGMTKDQINFIAKFE